MTQSFETPASRYLKIRAARESISYLLEQPILAGSVRAARLVGQNLIQTADLLLQGSFEEPVDQSLFNHFLTQLYEFEAILGGEFNIADVYLLLEKDGLSIQTLIQRGEVLFARDAELKVPSAVYDMREATKCIAFELGTAAGFHIMRALEGVVRRYWEVVSKGQPHPSNQSLGAYMQKFKSGDVVIGDPKIIAALQQIKDLHRNALIHPEEQLSVEDAVALLGVTQSAVRAMLRAIPTASVPLPSGEPQLGLLASLFEKVEDQPSPEEGAG